MLEEAKKKFFISDSVKDILKSQRKEGPEILDIAITGKCNLNCRHCYWGHENQKFDDIPFEELKKVFISAKNLGIYRVVLTGGEPTIHKDFDKIMCFLYKERFRVILVTNGHFIAQHKEVLEKYKPYQVVVSLDGFKETYEKIRNSKWEEVVSNIKYLKEINIPIRINCILSKEVYKDIDGFKRFCLKDLGADHVVFLPVALTGNALLNEDLFLDPRMAKEIIFKEGSFDDINCQPFYRRIAIGFDGFVYPCQFFREIEFYRLGNIKENSLFKIYKIIEKSGLFPKYEKGECISCINLDKCKGGCRGRAIALLNNPDKKDPIWCNIIKNKPIRDSLLPRARNPLYTILYKNYLENYNAPKELYSKAKEIVKELNPKKIIEIGCGDGKFIKSLENIKERVGVDSSFQMIKEAKKDSTKVKFIQGNIIKLNFHEKFDASIALFSFFNHFSNQYEIKKIFKKLEKISDYFIFDSMNPLKLPKSSEGIHNIGNIKIKQFVYRDSKWVYDLREYIKNKEKYYYGFSFPIINLEELLLKEGYRIIRKVPISKNRNLFLIRL